MRVSSLLFLFSILGKTLLAQISIIPSNSTPTSEGNLQYNVADSRLKYFDGTNTLFIDGISNNYIYYGYTRVNSAAFKPLNVGVEANFTNNTSIVGFISGTFQAVAPIKLKSPNTITYISVGLYDTSASNDCIIEIIGYYGDLLTPYVVATLQSSGNAGWATVSTTSINNLSEYKALTARIKPTTTWDNKVFISNVDITFNR